MGLSFAVAAGWIALAAVLCGLALSLRRASGTRGMRVLARLPIEPRRSLLVVEVAGRTLLLGSSEGGLAMLVELDAAEAASLAQGAEPASGFFSLAFGRRA